VKENRKRGRDMTRKKVIRQVEREASNVDDLIADILSRSVDEAHFFKAGKNYIIDGEVYHLVEITEDDPVVLVFLSSTGKRIDITPYSEVKIDEKS